MDGNPGKGGFWGLAEDILATKKRSRRKDNNEVTKHLANRMRMFVDSAKTCTLSSSSLESISRRDSQETVSNAYFTPPNIEYQEFYVPQRGVAFKQSVLLNPRVAYKTLFDPRDVS